MKLPFDVREAAVLVVVVGLAMTVAVAGIVLAVAVGR